MLSEKETVVYPLKLLQSFPFCGHSFILILNILNSFNFISPVFQVCFFCSIHLLKFFSVSVFYSSFLVLFSIFLLFRNYCVSLLYSVFYSFFFKKCLIFFSSFLTFVSCIPYINITTRLHWFKFG